MKIFLSENTPDYASYTFNYALYALKESQEELDEIYEKGFLPYTGNLDLESETFYMARSLRVDCDRFEDTSENRRVCRMVEPLSIGIEVVKKSDFNLEDSVFKAFCNTYISERIGDDNMSAERWDYILRQDTGSHFFVFKNDSQVFGYVLAAITDKSVQYWFAFFDTEYMRSHSLGKYMMWAVIDWAKKNKKQHVYLGTAYKSKALYKIRDHKGLSFFNGNGWSADVNLLKALCAADEEVFAVDNFKRLPNPNEYLKSL
ncbi:MAG: GNAT family N-acetyltransferase [Leadbetterella sp.]